MFTKRVILASHVPVRHVVMFTTNACTTHDIPSYNASLLLLQLYRAGSKGPGFPAVGHGRS